MYEPYFAQQQPERPIVGMIADLDLSRPYELDAIAVFKAAPRGYLVVSVSGCSCWPASGSTCQIYCADKVAVARAIADRGSQFATLLDKCQSARWRVTKEDGHD